MDEVERNLLENIQMVVLIVLLVTSLIIATGLAGLIFIW